jgi:hypothetical protein
VQESYLRAALDQMAFEFGSIDAYMFSKVGVAKSTLDRLRQRLDPELRV